MNRLARWQIGRVLVSVVTILWLAPTDGRGQFLPGRHGGTLVIPLSSEPKTVNPTAAADQTSRDIIYTLSADLVHINRLTLKAEPALAKSWKVTPDGRSYTVILRDGLRFSDGAPLTAADVVFTVQVHTDPAVASTQRDVLIVDKQPIRATKLSATTVRFDLPAPYGPGERLFDSIWILPRHKLEKAYREGRLAQSWNLNTPPSEIVTAGPFRLRQHVPGQQLILERNPYYWKKDEAGKPFPYLDRIVAVFVSDQNGQVLRLIAGEAHALGRVRPEDLGHVSAQPALRTVDAGGSLEYNFLFFNWNAQGHQKDWFRNVKFRQAAAHAIDREAILRLVYQGRGSAIWSQVTPGNRLWATDKLSRYPYDISKAEQLLRSAGFERDTSGTLRDPAGRPVEFSLMVSSSSQVRRKMATIIQADLNRLGMRVGLAAIEFGAMVDAVLKTRKFEAAVWGLASGDADPNSEMNVWTSGGTLHVWNLKAEGNGVAIEPWQAEIDRLMAAQMTATSLRRRKELYDRVQQLTSEHLPVIFLVSPHILAAARRDLANLQPAVLEPVLLWNSERLFWARGGK